MSEHKAIFKSATILSVFTVISRITGFIRDVLIAKIFGTGIAAQAFFVAFKIPNMLRDIMAEGAGNAAFVPVFCEYLSNKPRQDFFKLINSLLFLLVIVSLGVVCIGIILAHPLIQLVAPGFLTDSSKFHLTVSLTRILFPYLFLVTLSAYFMSVSNALKSFGVPASSSTIFNLVLILGILSLGSGGGINAAYILGVLVLLAGIIQVIVQYLSLVRLGVDFRKGDRYENLLKNDSIRKVGRLLVPRLIGTSIYQLNIFVDTIFASLSFFVGDGAIAAIYYANRIIQFPFSVFGIAVSNAALPTMSGHGVLKDKEKFNTTMNFSFKTVFLCMVPITAAVLVFAAPLVRAIYERGQFDAYSSDITTKAVFFYGLGLISYVGVRFLSSGFYALQDTLTPVKTASVALVANIILVSVFIFIFHLKLVGLALASSISASLNFFNLYRLMNKRTGYRFNQELKVLVKKAAVSSLAMILAVWPLWSFLSAKFSSLSALAVIALVGCGVYFFILWLWKVDELKGLLKWLKLKKK